MIEQTKSLKSRQICLFIIAFLPVSKLFMMPSIASKFAGEDMWISVLINLLLDFATVMILSISFKKHNLNFFELLENTFGKTISKIILAFYFLAFFFKTIIPLDEQRDYVEFTLYTLVPNLFYFLPFFVVAFYLCTKKLRAIGRLADVMWIVTLLGFIVLIILSFGNADFTAILPIGAQGFPNIIKGSYSTFLWFGDAIYFVFFIGQFKYQKKDTLKIALSYFAHIFIVILFAIIFYAIFTSIAFRQRFALTEISKYTTVINNIGRLDYIGILLILLSNAISLSLPIYFACMVLNIICNFKKRWIAPIIVISLHILILIFLNEFYATIENVFIGYSALFFFILGNLLPIATAFMHEKGGFYEANHKG